MNEVTITKSVPPSALYFPIPRKGRAITVKQGATYTVLQVDLPRQRVLISTSDNPEDNAWIPIEHVKFLEL